MSTATAPQHTPDELTFRCLDEHAEIAYFTSPSASKPGGRNVTALDIASGEAVCWCQGATMGRQCWHMAHVAAAWQAVAHRVRCERLTVAELEAHGHSLAKHLAQAEAAGQAFIAADLAVMLDTARRVWRARAARTVAPSVAAAPAELIAIPDLAARTLPLAA